MENTEKKSDTRNYDIKVTKEGIVIKDSTGKVLATLTMDVLSIINTIRDKIDSFTYATKFNTPIKEESFGIIITDTPAKQEEDLSKKVVIAGGEIEIGNTSQKLTNVVVSSPVDYTKEIKTTIR